MNKRVGITLTILGCFAVLLIVLGSGVAAGFTHGPGSEPVSNVIPGKVSSKNIAVPSNCVILSSGELECRDSLTQSISISMINQS